MTTKSRTTNTILNFVSSMGGQLLAIIMQFVTRTVFIATLGKSYLGINGLFSNILSMLSLAEFGVGSAILFKLYDPIANNDHQRIAVLMKFYKSAYRVIGLAVTILGVALIPFLPKIISDYDRLEALNINAIVIFLLYLLKTVSSYFFFAYKSALIKANQKEYLVNLIGYVFTIGAAIIQVICLYVFRDFIIYVTILILQVIGQNICCAILANRMYPYIKNEPRESLEKKEVFGVIKDCGALFLYKLNNVVLKATDNIVISMFLGIEMVGIYSNYYILYTTLNTLLAKVYNSVSHSLGNLHTDQKLGHEYEIFKVVMLITAILGGTAFAGIFVCSDELVKVWIGDEWVLQSPFSLLMGIEIFTLAFRLALSKYRSTMGLFQQAKYRPLFGMIINLIVSVALVNYLGISGVLIGTIVADWTTLMWFDPIIVHKYGFKEQYPVIGYFFRLVKYILFAGVIACIDYFICKNFIVGYKWFSVIIHALICGVTVPCGMLLLNINTEEGRYLYHLLVKNIKKVSRVRK